MSIKFQINIIITQIEMFTKIWQVAYQKTFKFLF